MTLEQLGDVASHASEILDIGLARWSKLIPIS